MDARGGAVWAVVSALFLALLLARRLAVWNRAARTTDAPLHSGTALLGDCATHALLRPGERPATLDALLSGAPQLADTVYRPWTNN